MLSLNFYYRINYLVKKKSSINVILNFIFDRLKHPFLSHLKKNHKKIHNNFLKTKNTSTDYFSINAYYWNNLINKNFKEFSYLEIGSWEGNSALYILKNFKTKKVVCVDIWKDKNYEEIQLRNFNNFKNNMREFDGKYTFFKGTSDNFFLNNKESFDIIYIDGSHEEVQVYKDIKNSWNVLNVDGIIICDDYFYGNLYGKSENVPAISINKFLYEFKHKLKIICVNNNQIFIKKVLD